MSARDEAISIATHAALAANEKLAEDISVIDVSDRLAITECFVIAHAATERQVAAIVEEIEDELHKVGRDFPIRREGTREGRWALLDYGDVVIHVFRSAEREFYGLDRLWADCPVIPVEGIEPVSAEVRERDDVDIRTVESIDDIPLAGDDPSAHEV